MRPAADLTRLWCIWELFVIHSTRSLKESICWSIKPFTMSNDNVQLAQAAEAFSVDDAGCYLPEDKECILGVIAKFQNGGKRAFEAKVCNAITELMVSRSVNRGAGRKLSSAGFSERSIRASIDATVTPTPTTRETI